jgi:hypothetical protein
VALIRECSAAPERFEAPCRGVAAPVAATGASARLSSWCVPHRETTASPTPKVTRSNQAPKWPSQSMSTTLTPDLPRRIERLRPERAEPLTTHSIRGRGSNVAFADLCPNNIGARPSNEHDGACFRVAPFRHANAQHRSAVLAADVTANATLSAPNRQPSDRSRLHCLATLHRLACPPRRA